MIISRTPFRISFVGGGTDLKEFYKDIPGAVLSTSIDKYIYQSMHEYFQKGKSLIKYSSTEEVDNINQIRHNIVREVFKMFSIDNVDFNSTADIASGTGMGSSSSFTSGLIKLCSEFNNSNLTNLQIAEIACQLEIDILGEPIGKQDQYACAVGGLNLIKFYPDESVEVKSLDLNFSDIKYLEDNLILFYTGSSRSASSILAQQQQNTLNSIKTKENLKIMSLMADSLYNDLKNKQFDLLGEYLNEGWQLKKELSSNISNNHLDDIYEIALKNGATGGKLLGAGSSGFFLFYVKKINQPRLIESLSFLRKFDFNLENLGTQIIYNDEK